MIITPTCADIGPNQVNTGESHCFELGPDLFCVFKVKARDFQLLRDPAKDLQGWKRTARPLHRALNASHRTRVVQERAVFLGEGRCRQDQAGREVTRWWVNVLVQDKGFFRQVCGNGDFV
jgi:hypothetical protein